MNKFCTFGKSDRLLDKQDAMLLLPEISIPQVIYLLVLDFGEIMSGEDQIRGLDFMDDMVVKKS